MIGTRIKEITAGTTAAANQPNQEILTPLAAARPTAATLGAEAVMKRLEEMVFAWNSLKIRYEPIFFSVPSDTLEPKVSDKDSMIGKTIPPDRAVLLGVAGETTKSIMDKE